MAATFRWPPAPLPPSPPSLPTQTGGPTPRPATPPTPIERVVGHARSLERAWLDPVVLPLRDRPEWASWRPSSFDEFCDRCGHDVGPHEENEYGCAACRSRRLPWQAFVRLGTYEPPLSDWIHELKFGRWRRTGVELGRALGARLQESGLLRHSDPSAVVVVPVPTTWRRRMGRGVDHSLCIARAIAHRGGWATSRLLARSHRPSQRSVPASERARNVSGSIRLRRGAGLGGRTVVLVDDVMTSGATLRAAARVLAGARPAPERLIAAVLAVTPRGR